MTDPRFVPLPPAKISWRQGQPVSDEYDDVYFSRENGLAETQYVFIDGNRLNERWQQLAGRDFTIGETGFGTGLNFLVAQALWLEKTRSGTLHYISAELAPLEQDELEQALSLWPGLKPLIDNLLAHYPLRLPGVHRIAMPEYRTTLTLLYGDASTGFASLQASDHPGFASEGAARVNAWFLDGFSPARNPAMWTAALFQAIANLSNTGTTFSTFTASGMAKQGLKSVGFGIEKTPGFGSKRDMLQGTFINRTASPAPTIRAEPPWYLAKQAEPGHVAIIGAGIAGCTTAFSLAKRGIQVTLIDKHPNPAQEASGNPQGILYPRLSPRMGALSRFALSALAYSSRFYQTLFNTYPEIGSQCGVILLAENPQQQAIHNQLGDLFPPQLVKHLRADELEATAGVRLCHESGLFFPLLGWVSPPKVCLNLVQHPNIRLVTADVDRFDWVDQRHWQLYSKNQPVLAGNSAPVNTLILACANNSNHFAQTAHLPLKPVRGQITIAPETTQSSNLKTVLCGTGYLAPAESGFHTLGASYLPGESGIVVSEQENRLNFEQLEQTDRALPPLFQGLEQSRLDGRAGTRCTTPDYLPIAGPVPILDDLLQRYSALGKNAKLDIPETANYWPNLYLHCGLGSRGLTYAPLCAELIASHLCGEVAPLPLDLVRALHPGRFGIRQLKRKNHRH